ncbi:hypothetical protein Taro_043069 [Colocasia esculenta]|uniref:Uncharacterized protein n=1 Tax=Colocasia esculenta TaxID=4460 RepID=A0A843WUM3_COLES|nr:hypothetical protein [Colocasia esculenta]
MHVDSPAQTDLIGCWQGVPVDSPNDACRQICTDRTHRLLAKVCLSTDPNRLSKDPHRELSPGKPVFFLLQVCLHLSTDAILVVNRRRKNLNTRSPYVSELGVSKSHDSPYLNTHKKGTLWSYFRTEAAIAQNPKQSLKREDLSAALLQPFVQPTKETSSERD